MENVIQLVRHHGEPRVDSMEIARHLGTDHASTIKLVRRYESEFRTLGLVGFEIRARPKGQHGGGDREVALLNEDQCYLLLTFSRPGVAGSRRPVPAP